jgi:hypothetical protein
VQSCDTFQSNKIRISPAGKERANVMSVRTLIGDQGPGKGKERKGIGEQRACHKPAIRSKIALDRTRDAAAAANKAIQLTARNDPRKSQVIPSAMRRPMASPPVSTRREHGRSGMRAAVRCLRLRDAFMVRDLAAQLRGAAGVADVES